MFIDGSENGGFWVDQGGNLHIIRPWSDDEALAKSMRQLRAANSLLQLAQTSGDTDLSHMAGSSGVNLLRAAQLSLEETLAERDGSELLHGLLSLTCLNR